MKATLEGVREFQLSLERSKELTREKGVELQGVVTLDLLARLQTGNPVRSGRSRAGWIASVGVPSLVSPPPAPTGTPSPVDRSVFAAVAKVNQAAAIGLKFTFGTPSWLANNVNYIGHVNRSHPRRAGFVDAAVELTARRYGLGVG